ncbi:MAG: zinc ribbon domain-containing protein [Deltaproteobacteria bacterium]|nr:zinc ribbon domain-containing protein [Deltaproteobacteria bacterium]
MPIYEYQAVDPARSCDECCRAFEAFQRVCDEPLAKCPRCGNPVKKLISWCRAAVMETSDEESRVTSSIREYESQGMWSHAAELADKHSEKTKDPSLKTRALDNYKKAGYDVDSLIKE